MSASIRITRQRLFDSQQGERFEVPVKNKHGLRFAAFFDGWTSDGYRWIIGIECTDFPDVLQFTFNGSHDVAGN